MLTTNERSELLDHLIGNCDCENAPKFGEKDRGTLNKMSDDELLVFVGNAGCDKEQDMSAEGEEEMVDPKELKKRKAQAMMAGKKPAFNEASLPLEIREQLAFARNIEQQQKDELITKITANADVLFTNEELQEKSVDELTKIASLAPKTLNFSSATRVVPRLGGHKQPVRNNEVSQDEILESPVINWSL